MTVTDEFTRYTWTWTLPNKEAETILNIIAPWQRRVERQCGGKLTIFHTDGGNEFSGLITC
jgi:hypothetical protein